MRTKDSVKRSARVIGITDRAADATTAAIQTRMMTAFVRSTQYEWLFWDGAYQQRGWPLA